MTVNNLQILLKQEMDYNEIHRFNINREKDQ